MKKRQEVYDLYWYFAYERQNIFWKKLNGEVAPWTDDEILQTYKFCNSYRVNDRVSQYLLKNVIYNGKQYNDEDMIFRIILFKLFNKESTWELLLDNFDDITLKTFDVKKCRRTLNQWIKENYYNKCREKQYKYIKRKIICAIFCVFNKDNLLKSSLLTPLSSYIAPNIGICKILDASSIFN